MRTVVCFLVAGLLMLGRAAAGQPTASAADSVAAARAGYYYQHSLQGESALHLGVEYVNELPDFFQETPFYLGRLPQRGSLGYQGRRYTRVPLHYEEVKNCVVLLDTTRNVAIQLFSDEITDFTLAGHRFVRLRADSAAPADFYEVLADGPVRLLATRHKSPVKHATSVGVVGELVVANRYYVERAGQLTRVARLRQVLALLPEQRAALQQLVRSQHLSDKEQYLEASMAALVQRFNELAGQPRTARP